MVIVLNYIFSNNNPPSVVRFKYIFVFVDSSFLTMNPLLKTLFHLEAILYMGQLVFHVKMENHYLIHMFFVISGTYTEISIGLKAFVSQEAHL